MLQSRLDERRRGKVEIIAEILVTARKPAKKTQIMYECNLGFKQLEYYLGFMMLKGLIRRNEEAGTVAYQTTKAGKSYLRRYRSMARWLQKAQSTPAE